MSHLHSVRVPATIVFIALLAVILLSSSQTTYRLSPAPPGTPQGATPRAAHAEAAAAD